MRWNERRRRACQIILFFFFFFFVAIFSLAMHFFCFQNKVAHGERNIFACDDYVVGTLMIFMSD